MVRGYYLTTEMQTICSRIMLRRKQMKVSQTKLGQKLGISQQAYSLKELQGTFSMTDFFAVCEVLKMDPSELVKEAIK